MKLPSLSGLLAVLVLAACSGSPATVAPAVNIPLATATRLVVVPTAAASAVPTLVVPTTVPSTVPAKPVGQPVDAKAAILAALEALDKNGPYRMTITASSEPGGPVILDVVPPDRSIYKGSMNGKPVVVINIGNTAYVLNPDGTWQTSTTAETGTADLLFDPAGVSDLTSIELLPPQTLKGTPTTVYSFVDTASPEAKVTLWVNRDKGRPVQLQTTSADEMVVYVIDYDAGIKVEAPVK
jgi:hypothetical protein